MLYPEIINVKKANVILKMMIFISIIVSAICIFINIIINKRLSWSILVISGIIYSWITTMYSIKKNINIASHVMLQTISMSFLLVIIDLAIGYKGWSLNIALPIVISVSNITMMILTVITYNKYFKYAIYEVIIFLWSLIPILLVIFKVITILVPTVLSIAISIFTLVTTTLMCGKDLREKLERVFHI